MAWDPLERSRSAAGGWLLEELALRAVPRARARSERGPGGPSGSAGGLPEESSERTSGGSPGVSGNDGRLSTMSNGRSEAQAAAVIVRMSYRDREQLRAVSAANGLSMAEFLRRRWMPALETSPAAAAAGAPPLTAASGVREPT